MNNKKTDVLVIGGGPAGTTCATLLKQKGYDVTLLEKDQHPRFHIGESLLPMNLPILERLGVLESVKSIGIDKMGADFSVGNRQIGEQTFYFKDALGGSPPQAYEVRRADFDQILFENCKSNGVHAFEGVKVKHVEAIDDGCHQVTAIDESGNEHVWQTRFLIDASGRDTFMSSKNGWKQPNRKHASAAIYSHFSGVTRRPGIDQGNISIYWFESGWIWMIPLQDDIMSIGMVCYPDYLKQRKGSRDEFLLETLNSITEIKQRLHGSQSVMPAVATGNYSYSSDKIYGPGFLMVGDAFAFVDPVFSSGVYLAMHSAEIGVPIVESWFGPTRGGYDRACRQYEKQVRKGIANFSWFIYRFTSPVMRNLMSNPKNDLQIAQAVISMLAGDVFNNHKVARRLFLFRSIYALSWLFNWREAMAYRKLYKSRLKVDS